MLRFWHVRSWAVTREPRKSSEFDDPFGGFVPLNTSTQGRAHFSSGLFHLQCERPVNPTAFSSLNDVVHFELLCIWFTLSQLHISGSCRNVLVVLHFIVLQPNDCSHKPFISRKLNISMPGVIQNPQDHAERIHHTLARMFAAWHLASAKIVKIEFNANLYLLGFPHFIAFTECKKVPWSERKLHRKT